MPGPWDDYQSAASSASGPWDDYAATKAAAPSPEKPAAPATGTQGSSVFGRALGGAIEPGLQLATGALAAPAAGIAGLATGAGRVLGMTDKKPGDVVRSVENALTYQPKTVGGKAASEVIGYPFKKLAEGADWAGGKVTDVLSRVPALRGAPAATAGAGINTALQAIPMLFGAKPAASALEKTPRFAPERPAPIGPMAEATSKARSSGFVLPPTETRPNLLNRAIEGWGGKSNVEQAASIKNQPKTNSLARRAIGLKPNAPLDEQTFRAVRKEAGKEYAAVRDNPTPIEMDKEYFSTIESLGGDFAEAKQKFPDLFKSDDIATLKDSLLSSDVYTMKPSEIISAVQKLRSDANTNLKGANFSNPEKRALGLAQKKAADAMDGLMERRLQQAGHGDLADNYRKARTRIAQTYDVEAATNEFTGNVDARKMASIAGKRPLSAELRDIAEFGGAFKQVARPPESFGGHPGINPLDVGLALVEAASSGNPKWLGSIFARPLAAKVATSAPYQRRFAAPPGGPRPILSPGLLRLLLGSQQGTQSGQPPQ